MEIAKHEFKCAICGESCEEILRYIVRNEHEAILARCQKCEFCFVVVPTWLGGSFSETLQSLDIGTVDRCALVLDFVQTVARVSSWHIDNRFIDWGGGYGLMTRMPRDRGMNMANFDPYVQPLFSAPANLEKLCPAEVIVASEVFLHVENPLDALAQLLSFSPVVIITAVVPPDHISPDWWYLMPDTGQHVSFYPVSTLKKLAEMTEAKLLTDGRFFHIFSREELPFRTRAVVRSRFLTFGISYILDGLSLATRSLHRSRSLTQSDHEVIRSSGFLKEWQN
jgi:hypothetical protein